jgi:hypothetical protein
VSEVDAFLSTWSNARETFGAGVPTAGADFDESDRLRALQSTAQSAAPGGQWTGAASAAYGAANDKHGERLGQFATLDQKVAAAIDQSAAVVSAGRTNLDSVRKWVIDAAASVPQNEAGRAMLPGIVSTGLGRLTEIVEKSNTDLAGIGDNIRLVSNEYKTAGGDPALGNGDNHEKVEAVDPRKQAEQDVQDALAGDQDAAARVEDVLNEVQPGQELTPEQGSYLSQMQAQQHGMSVDELKTAEQRLGDHKKIMADSWQLMQNDKVWFPHTDTTVDALDDPSNRVRGGMDQLPTSVQDVLNDPAELTPFEDGTNWLTNRDDLTSIGQIVADGDPRLQVNTELDRQLMGAADQILDADVAPWQASDPAQSLFQAVADDHVVVHDQLMSGAGKDFVHDINTMPWNDDGKAAALLFSWTNEASGGPEAAVAAETAEQYAKYLADPDGGLMNIHPMPGDPNATTLGELNPELVKGYAHGLTPYMDDTASLREGTPDNFDQLDPTNSDRPNAKALFAVLSTQHDAYVEFNGAADALALQRAQEWADAVDSGAKFSATDERLLDGAVLRGLVACGGAEAAHAMNLNSAEIYEWRKSAYGAGVTMLAGGMGPGGPAFEAFGSMMESSFLGSPPATDAPIIPNMGEGEAARFALNALLAEGVDVPALDPKYVVNGHIPTLQELRSQGPAFGSDLSVADDLNIALGDVTGQKNPAASIAQFYEDIVKRPSGK